MGESLAVTDAVMSEGEARQYVDWIKSALEDARGYLLELYERKGWRALGYDSWRACVQAEFGQSRSQLYRELDAARTERVLLADLAISPMGETPIPERQLRPLASIADRTPDLARDIWREITETAPNGTVTAAHVARVVEQRQQPEPIPEQTPTKHAVHYSSESPEWYTPADIIERASRVMLGIGLDPCADPERRVPAQQHYTAGDDGLAQAWPAVSVWMNPPYGREIMPWVQTWLSHVQAENEGMALLPARTDTDWFQPLFTANVAFCFIDGRLKFSGHKNSAPFPSVIAYSGDNLLGFYEEFHDLGGMVMPWCPEDAGIGDVE